MLCFPCNDKNCNTCPINSFCTDCKSPYIANSKGKCIIGIDNCQTHSHNGDKCFQCRENYFLSISQTKCLSKDIKLSTESVFPKLEMSFYLNSLGLIKFSNTQSNISSSKNYLLDLSEKELQSIDSNECSLNYFLFKINILDQKFNKIDHVYSCSKCFQSNCNICYDNTFSSCIRCTDSYSLFKGNCLESCPEGYQSITGRCQPIECYSSSNTDSNYALIYNPDYNSEGISLTDSGDLKDFGLLEISNSEIYSDDKINEYVCSDKCSLGQYFHFLEQKCYSCRENCSLCENQELCFKCNTSQKVFRSKTGICKSCKSIFEDYQINLRQENYDFLKENFYKIEEEPFCSRLHLLSFNQNNFKIFVYNSDQMIYSSKNSLQLSNKENLEIILDHIILQTSNYYAIVLFFDLQVNVQDFYTLSKKLEATHKDSLIWQKEISLHDFELENLRFKKQKIFQYESFSIKKHQIEFQKNNYSNKFSIYISQTLKNSNFGLNNEFTFKFLNFKWGLLKCNLNCLQCQNSYSCLKCEVGMIWDPVILQCKIPYTELVSVVNLKEFIQIFGKFIIFRYR